MQYLVMILLITNLMAGGYGMWQKIQLQEAQAEIQVLVIERDAAQASQRAAEEAQEFQAIQVKQFEAKNAQLQADAVLARKQVQYTRDLFNDHDFANLMAKKPGLITIRMQKATDAVFADLRAITK
jgi:hypothetical protein